MSGADKKRIYLQIRASSQTRLISHRYRAEVLRYLCVRVHIGSNKRYVHRARARIAIEQTG